jgi:hypothetical protein
MPNVQYVNRSLEHNKEEAIGAPVAGAEEQFADGFVKGSALRSQRTTLGAAGKTVRALSRAPDPVASRVWRLAADIAVSCPEIGLSLGSDDDAISHLPDGVFLFEFVKYFVRQPARAFAGLCKTSANARHGVEVARDFLVCAGVEEHGLGFAIHGKHQRTPRFLHALHQAGRVALERGQRMNVLRHINHGAIIASF